VYRIVISGNRGKHQDVGFGNGLGIFGAVTELDVFEINRHGGFLCKVN